MKQPRHLRVLRVNDRYVEDLLCRLPLEVDRPDLLVSRWIEFCDSLAARKLPACDVMLVDINFDHDESSPRMPSLQERSRAYELNSEYAIGDDFRPKTDRPIDPGLARLGWSPRLFAMGQNTGILIGASLASYFAGTGKPIGVGVHMGYDGIVTSDMTSAMLLAQTLLASGYEIATDDYRKVLGAVTSRFAGKRESAQEVVPEAVAQFRDAFWRYAGARGAHAITVWVEQESVAHLLDIFDRCETEEALDRELAKYGLEYYDMHGVLDSLSIPSLFADILMEPLGRQRDFLKRLPLEAVKAPHGKVYTYVHRLASASSAYLDRVFGFFKESAKEPAGSINERLESPFEKFLAMLLAYLDVYADYRLRFGEEYDPFAEVLGAGHTDLKEGLGSFQGLHKALLTVVERGPGDGDAKWDIRNQFIPLSGAGLSIMKAVEHHARGSAQGSAGDLLYAALRYDVTSTDGSALSGRRRLVVQKMLDRLWEWGCVARRVREGEPEYLLENSSLPKAAYFRVDQGALAGRLGFTGADSSNPLQRILKSTPGYQNVPLAAFLQMLADRPLPPHLQSLCERYLRECREDLSAELYPLCLQKDRPRVAPSFDWQPEAVSPEDERAAEARRAENRRVLTMMQERLVEPDASVEMPDGTLIVARNRSAYSVGGDGYRILRPNGNTDSGFGLLVADVAGKGLPGLLQLDRLLGPVDLLKNLWTQPADLCAEIHRHMVETFLIEGRYATVFACAVDEQRRCLRFVNAFHDRLAMVVRRSGSMEIFDSAIPMLGGQVPLGGFAEQTFQLEPGDILAILTDGITEAPDRVTGKDIGSTAVGRLIREKFQRPLEEILHGVFELARDGDRQDDQTALLCRFPG